MTMFADAPVFLVLEASSEGLSRVVSVSRTVTPLYLLVENPAALTTTSYAPTGSEGTLKLPPPSENTVRAVVEPPAEETSICAPEIGAPLTATTTLWVIAPCRTRSGQKHRLKAENIARKSDTLIFLRLILSRPLE